MQGGKRKCATYELLAKWVHKARITTGIKGLIVKGFKENGYVDFKGSIDHLHPGLQQTLAHGIAEEALRGVNKYLREMAYMHIDEVHYDDDKIQELGEGSGNDLDPLDPTANAATNDSVIDNEMFVVMTVKAIIVQNQIQQMLSGHSSHMQMIFV